MKCNPVLSLVDLSLLGSMTGIEAAERLLGVLPLLIPALEHFDNVGRPFSRYRNFTPEVRRFQQRFIAQKVTFQNECRLLLSKVTEYDVAIKMLEDGNHPSWEDQKLIEGFAEYLGH